MTTKTSFKYKIVFLGHTSVGKSSISTRYVQNKFFEFQEPTIGAAFLAKKVELDDYTVNFEIWDTAGQERYNALAPMYYRGANVAIVVYDVTNKDSLIKAKFWITELKNNVDNIFIVLVGNKCDLKNEINQNNLNEYISINNLEHYLSSAKNNVNIENIFINLATKLPNLKYESNVIGANLHKQNYNKNSCC